MDEVEFHAPPRESKSKRWLSFHPFSGSVYIMFISCLYHPFRGHVSLSLSNSLHLPRRFLQNRGPREVRPRTPGEGPRLRR